MPPDDAPAVIVNEAPADISPALVAEAESRVEVEEVAGETAVAIAEIHAETDQAAIAAAHDAELIQCRANLETSQAENSLLRGQVETLEATVLALTPPPPPVQPNPADQPPSDADALPAEASPPPEPKPAKRPWGRLI